MTDASQNLSMAERIDTVCDQFEREFRAGQRPALESVLATVVAKERPALFRALLELELELRQKAGEAPQPADYQARFPTATKTIADAFEAARRAPAIISSVNITGIETSQGPKSKAAAAAPSVKPALLQKLGRFQIKSVLGEGAFGTVYRARDPHLDRDVAVKVPRFAGQQSQADRARFLREARAAAGLQHAHICPVHEVGNADGRDYIVLSLIDGKPLSKILQSQPKLSNRQIAAVIRKLALALQEAHDLGIIHRDLKPANIMINRKGEPVIMDFGLARRSNSGDAEISHHGQIMGTPAYMSPEQARGDGKAVGLATDIYSLGILLYEMICGRRPFEGTVTEVIASILHVDPPRPSQFRATIDPRLEQICLRAIAKHPTERFVTMKEFADALAEYARAVPTDVPDAEPAVESGKELPTNQFADLLAAISSEMESKVERAVRRADRPVRMPWWSYLIGSGAMGLVVLLGILFFVRKETVTVIVNIPIENIHDPALTFLLDDKPIAATAFAEPIELKPGEHHLIVNKGGKLFKEFRFQVGRKNDQPIIVHDMTPSAASEESPPEPQEPLALKPSPLDVVNAADIPDEKLIKNYGSRDQAPRELVALLTNHNMDPRDTYASMDIAPDGKVLATSRYPLNWIILRNLASGLQFGEIATEPKKGWVHFIWLRFSSDGKTLYGQRIDENLYAFAVGGKELWHTASRKNYCFPAVAPDDSIVVVAEADTDSKDLRVLDAGTGVERTKWKGLLDGPVYRLEFSPDGKSLAVMSGSTLKLVDPQKGTVRKSITLPMRSSEPRFRNDGKTVFHTHDWKEPEDYVAETILDTEQTREYRLPPHGCRNPVPNPRFPIVVTSDKHKKLHVWDTRLGPDQKPYVIPLGSNAEKVEFTPEGRYLVAAANTGVFVFRLPVDKKVAEWSQQYR